MAKANMLSLGNRFLPLICSRLSQHQGQQLFPAASGGRGGRILLCCLFILLLLLSKYLLGRGRIPFTPYLFLQVNWISGALDPSFPPIAFAKQILIVPISCEPLTEDIPTPSFGRRLSQQVDVPVGWQSTEWQCHKFHPQQPEMCPGRRLDLTNWAC